MAAAGDVLVALAHPHGTAGVVADGDGLWLTDELDRGGMSGIDGYGPTIQGLADGRTLAGGRLPPGAVGAELVDDARVRVSAMAANGAWVTILDQPPRGPIPPVRFTDAVGATVAPPLPRGVSPARDVTEPCPACGATAWVRTDAGGGGTMAPPGRPPVPVRRVVCERCGHEEAVGVWGWVAADPEPSAGELRRAEDERRRRDRRALESARVPIYVAAGKSARLAGWGSHGGRGVTSVTVAQPDAFAHGDDAWLHVTSELERHATADELELARGAMETLLEGGGDWPDGPEEQVALWLHARRRDARATAIAIQPHTVALPVDGVGRDFVFLENGDAWSAAHRDGDLQITLAASGVARDDVALERVADPLSLLSR